jgi:REP element-mobilizing transposase RayT
MARKKRSEVFVPSEVAIVHTICKVVRRCMLMGYDRVTKKNYDHRKVWIENELKRLSSYFAIDVLAFSILSNHVHQVLRSRPDIVETWSDREVARRWLQLCPTVAQVKQSACKQKQEAQATMAEHPAAAGENPENTQAPPYVEHPENAVNTGNGLPPPPVVVTGPEFPFAMEPPEAAINMIVSNSKKLKAIRLRLSDISWWMRLMCQCIAQRANAEEEEEGKFWRGRFKGIRLMDEAAILTCTAYVDLNVIRAALAETLEKSDYTSAQRRIQDLQAQAAAIEQAAIAPDAAFRIEKPLPLHQWLSPIELKQGLDVCGADQIGRKGFLMMTCTQYIELLEWTARQLVPGKRGATPEDTPPILQRLNISAEIWHILTSSFDSLFGVAAGCPTTLDKTPGPTNRPFKMRGGTRELLADVQTAS